MARIGPHNDPTGAWADFEHELMDQPPVTVCCGAQFIDDTDICGACREHASADD